MWFIIFPQNLYHLLGSAISEIHQGTPEPLLFAVFHSLVNWCNSFILCVKKNNGIISGLFYLRVVFTWHLLMHWTTSMQSSRDTLCEAGFDMNKHFIGIFSRQSSQTHLLLWSIPQIVNQCISCASQFTYFSAQTYCMCENMLMMYSIATKFCYSVYIKCFWAK